MVENHTETSAKI